MDLLIRKSFLLIRARSATSKTLHSSSTSVHGALQKINIADELVPIVPGGGYWRGQYTYSNIYCDGQLANEILAQE